jgi:citronellyl-CoA dehydrogenase
VAESLDAVLGDCAQLVGADAFAPGGLAQLRAEAGMFAIAGGARGAMLAGIADHATDLLERGRR